MRRVHLGTRAPTFLGDAKVVTIILSADGVAAEPCPDMLPPRGSSLSDGMRDEGRLARLGDAKPTRLFAPIPSSPHPYPALRARTSCASHSIQRSLTP